MDDELKTVTVTPRYQEGTMTDAVIIPALRSLFISLVIALIALLLAIRFLHLGFWDCLFVFGIVGLVSILVSWLSESKYWIWLIETVLTKDVNGDGVVGQPEPEPSPSLELTLHSHDHAQKYKHPIPYAERLPTLARGLMNGLKLTQAEWVGKSDGKPFSRPEWQNLLSALEGFIPPLVEKVDPHVPNSEYRLTEAGQQFMMQMATHGVPDGQVVISPEGVVTYACDINLPPLPRGRV